MGGEKFNKVLQELGERWETVCRSLMPHAILSKVVPKKRFTSQSWKIVVTEPGLCRKIGWGW